MSLNELKNKTGDVKKPITGISRIIVETDEKNPPSFSDNHRKCL